MWKHCCSTCTMMCAYYRFSCILAGLQIRFEIAEGSFLDSDVCLIKRFGGRFSYIHWFRGNPRTDPFPLFFRPLGKDSPIAHVASLLRVSSPQQLDYPALHESVKDILQGMFPTDPASFTHDHPLHDVLPIATEFNLRAVSF